MKWAHLADPFAAVDTSNIEPYPHQIDAVYNRFLEQKPLRFLLADDPGAGKTIMSGLLIRELMLRGDVARCLIVAPGSLCRLRNGGRTIRARCLRAMSMAAVHPPACAFMKTAHSATNGTACC